MPLRHQALRPAAGFFFTWGKPNGHLNTCDEPLGRAPVPFPTDIDPVTTATAMVTFLLACGRRFLRARDVGEPYPYWSRISRRQSCCCETVFGWYTVGGGVSVKRPRCFDLGVMPASVEGRPCFDRALGFGLWRFVVGLGEPTHRPFLE